MAHTFTMEFSDEDELHTEAATEGSPFTPDGWVEHNIRSLIGQGKTALRRKTVPADLVDLHPEEAATIMAARAAKVSAVREIG